MVFFYAFTSGLVAEEAALLHGRMPMCLKRQVDLGVANQQAVELIMIDK